MRRNIETQEGSFNPEFTARKPLPAFVVDTSGIPDNYHDTFNFSDINLLGLSIHMRNALLRSGIRSIRQLHETDDAGLRTNEIGIGTVAAARSAIERFRVELEALYVPQDISEGTQSGNTIEPVTINAIDWMDSHGLTWEGTPKTPLILKIEKAFGQNLGHILIEKYVKEELSASSIAILIRTQSDHQIDVTLDEIIQFMKQYCIKRRTTGEAYRIYSNRSSQQKTIAPKVEDFAMVNPRRANISTDRHQEMKSCIDQAKSKGTWDRLNEREKFILFMLYGVDIPISAMYIAEILGISGQRVGALALKAFGKL